MSPTTATPFAASRIGSSKRRSGLRRSEVHGSGLLGHPGLAASGSGGVEGRRLRIVRDEGHPGVTARHPARPVPLYRSELSSRTRPAGAETRVGEVQVGEARVNEARVVEARVVEARGSGSRTAGSRADRGPAHPGRGRSFRPAAPGQAGATSVRSAESPVRLTRRGRLVVRAGSAGLVVLTLVAGVLLLDRTAEAGSTAKPVPVTYRVVLPGETLWQIAGEIAPDVDRRDTVADLLELNALPSGGVNAGQRIAVPVRTP